MSSASDRSAENDPAFGWAPPGGPLPSVNELDPAHAAFASLIDAVRGFQDSIAGAAPPADVSHAVERQLGGLIELLEPHLVGEQRQLFNRIPAVTGHAQSLTPTLLIDEASAHEVRGRVTFTRFHLGGRWAAHGGAIALMFDSLLGRLAISGGRPRSRTAYLRVDYRHITPLETELQFAAEFVREEGRKRYLTGTMHAGDVLCAEANGLFLELLPGQP
jgi:acyl-coenzyme A thioesterase PaaI-like protein